MDTTETRNPHSIGLDAMTDDAILRVFGEGQVRAVAAVRDAGAALAGAAEAIVSRIGDDGRLIYVGAGSSGLIVSNCASTTSAWMSTGAWMSAGSPGSVPATGAAMISPETGRALRSSGMPLHAPSDKCSSGVNGIG